MEGSGGTRALLVLVKKLEEPDEGTDRWAVDRGYISMTPLRLDLTDEEQLAMAKTQVPIASTGDGRPSSAAS